MREKIGSLGQCLTGDVTAALAIITDFANSICTSLPLEQQNKQVELSVDAKVKLKGVAGKLADAGVGGAANFKEGVSRGVIQSDLAKAIKDGDDCRLAVSVKLIDILIPTFFGPPKPPPILITEDRVNRHDNTRVIPTGEKVEDGGLFQIVLHAAPGPITSVDYECQGGVCGHVYPCPDGGKCGRHLNRFEISGQNATFSAWSNSADTGIFIFTIHYQKAQ